MIRVVFALLLLVTLGARAEAPTVAPAVVGHVSVVSGEAWLMHGEAREALVAGSAIPAGATLATGHNGYLYISLVDLGLLTLRPDSSATLVSYHIDRSHPQRNDIRIHVHHGVVRSVTGLGGQRAHERYQLRTPLAVVGIRGTDFTVAALAEATRVSVTSGGIVMAPAAVCGDVQLGPCLQGAKALMADNPAALLEVTARSVSARLIENADPSLRPDSVRAPAPDEAGQVRQVPAHARGTDPSIQSSVASREDALGSSAEAAVVRQAALQAAAPEGEAPDLARWGRWREVVGMSDADALNALRQARALVALSDRYALVRDPGPWLVLPEKGQFNYTLGSYEASFVKAGKEVAPSQISAAGLTLDLAANRFNVGLTASGTPGTWHVVGTGEVTRHGVLQSDVLLSPLQLSGVVQGAQGQRVVSIFSAALDNELSLQGGGTWQVTGAAPVAHP